MARTSANLIKKIITPAVDTETFAGPIAVANAMVNNYIVNNSKCASVDDTTLELIERYLAAHYYALDNPSIVSESADGTSETYERGQTGMGLDSTRFGQTALELDTCGGLLAAKKRRRAAIHWLGTKESEQTDEPLK